MWCVKPSLLCNQHLLGEHVELHMLVGTIKRGRSIKGFLEDGLVDLGQVYQRHDELAIEMGARMFWHRSPLERIQLPDAVSNLDVLENLRELHRRCAACRQNINLAGVKL